MYADPQTITITGGATAFPKIGSPDPVKKGRYRNVAGDHVLDITQNVSTGRFRREVRLTQTKVAADPISNVNKEASASVIIVFDEPRNGFSDAELSTLYAGLTTWMAASSNAARDKLLIGEF